MLGWVERVKCHVTVLRHPIPSSQRGDDEGTSTFNKDAVNHHLPLWHEKADGGRVVSRHCGYTSLKRLADLALAWQAGSTRVVSTVTITRHTVYTKGWVRLLVGIPILKTTRIAHISLTCHRNVTMQVFFLFLFFFILPRGYLAFAAERPITQSRWWRRIMIGGHFILPNSWKFLLGFGHSRWEREKKTFAWL